MLVKFRFAGWSPLKLDKFQGADIQMDEWKPLMAAAGNQMQLTLKVDGCEYTNDNDGIYMDEDLRIMIPAEIVPNVFHCGVHMYDEQLLMIEKRDDVLYVRPGWDYFIKNKEKKEYETPMIRVEETGYIKEREKKGLYIPADFLAEALDYSYQWDVKNNILTLEDISGAESILPCRYDMREKGRAPQVRDQGNYGTCWAFAALTALESSLLPERQMSFSVDHMNQNNSFHSPTKDGGQYTMAMAYLAGWQGPADEADDPYGDGITDETLTAVAHVQEMQLIEAGDLEGIKEAVFQYGGVESCIYTTMQGAGGYSANYNDTEHAYCYIGEEKPNHDIVIIGWDDNYPKEYFAAEPSEDGAFICQNSWGSSFGDHGVFYVSYFDSNIGTHNLVYTGVEDAANYDRLYQADLCGWVGQMGFNKESVYGANVYMAQENEEVAAAGFYTTGKDTEYEVYVAPEFTDVESLDSRMWAAQGKISNAGYHTVQFDRTFHVEAGRKFAVIIRLSTPDALRPMAIEYKADELTQEVDLDDGEGYVSAQGYEWIDARKASSCNLCIKAYTIRQKTQDQSL